jgi:hypothetical protein
MRLSLLHSSGAPLVAAASTNHTVSVYAGSFEGVVSKCHKLVSRKLFSLPKLLLIPPIIAHQVHTKSKRDLVVCQKRPSSVSKET